MRRAALWIAASALCGLSTTALAAEGACESLTPVMAGGPAPAAGDRTTVFRWFGTANYEMVRDGKVYLLDAYFDRKILTRDIGMKAEQVRKADAIFIGHAHYDHMSDAVPIAKRTGAKIYGAAITADVSQKLGLPKDQAVAMKDGDRLKIGDMSIDAGLAQHSDINPETAKTMRHVFDLEMPAPTKDEDAQMEFVRKQGSADRDILRNGTLAFAFTFDDGFKVLFLDSAGPVTEGDRKLAERTGPVDVAIVAYQGHPVSSRQIAETLPLVKLFRPKLFLPAHHDESYGSFVDLAVEPLFERIRAEMPGAKFVSPLYRTPVCVPAGK